MLQIKWEDVYNFDLKYFLESVAVTESKTGKTKLVVLNRTIIAALTIYLFAAKQGEYLIKSRKGGAISRIQAYRIIRAAAEALGFRSRVSCHSLRKTFGYHAWQKQHLTCSNHGDIQPLQLCRYQTIPRRYTGR